jgi:hypothetical protein
MINVNDTDEPTEKAVCLNFRYHLDCNSFLDRIGDEYHEMAIKCIKDTLEDAIWRLLCDLDHQKITTIHEMSDVVDLYQTGYEDEIYEQYKNGKGEGEILGYKRSVNQKRSLLFTLLVERDPSLSDKYQKELTHDLNG